jgi:Protein of unknown function (DUF664)
MGDQKPPRLVGDERETLLALLQYQRHSLVKKVSGMSEEDARRSMVASGTSLLWLVRHMARAESLWLLHRFAGQPAVIEDDQVRPEDTVQTAIAAYQQTWLRTDAIVAAAPSPATSLPNRARRTRCSWNGPSTTRFWPGRSRSFWPDRSQTRRANSGQRPTSVMTRDPLGRGTQGFPFSPRPVRAVPNQRLHRSSLRFFRAR